MNIFEQLKRSFAITKKDLSIYYLKGSVIIQGLLIPAFVFISFIFKREMSLDSLIPGLLGMALFFCSICYYSSNNTLGNKDENL